MHNALVPMAPTPGPEPAPQLASAHFLAHLIATARQEPQTRARRRAAPGEAVAAYDALGQWPTPIGHRLVRTV